MMDCDLIVKGKYLLPIDGAMTIIDEGAVAVKGDMIIVVGPAVDIEKAYRAENVIDAGNSIVMPGLINCHTHAAMSFFRGLADDLPLDTWLNEHIWPAEREQVNAEFVKKAAGLACEEMICSGTTCFNDMYFFEEEAAAIAAAAGIRICAGEAILDFPTPSSKTPAETIDMAESRLKRFNKNDMVRTFFAPHSIYTCKPDTLKILNATASDHHRPLHIHLSETEKEVTDCRRQYGKSPVKHLDGLGLLDEQTIAVHCVWLDDDDITLCAERKAKIVHCPVSNMKLASGAAPIAKMLAAGLVVGLGTDGPASNNVQDMFQEMKAAALLAKVSTMDPTALNARQVVRMATINGAIALGMEKEIGSLEIGKKADIITVSLSKPHLQPIHDPYSHLVYVVNGSDVSNVIVNSQVLLRNYQRV